MHLFVSFITGAALAASSWFGFAPVSSFPAAATTAPPVASTVALRFPAGSAKPLYLTFDMDMNGFMYRKTERTGKQWYDPAVFTYLEQNHIPATFFVSGLFVTTYPQLVQSLASSSQFSFENHSYDESSFVPHCYWLKTLTTDQQKTDQIQKTEQIIKQYTGQTATLFRFPGACTNAQNDALVKRLGYTVNDGTDVSGDPFNKNAEAVVQAVLAHATAGGTVLMHVGGPNAPESLAVLKLIVPRLRAEGYHFEKF
jgi:peptidoglycan-N-acetylglucosamine deacetylase